MLCGSVAGGSGSRNARRACCLAPKSEDRKERRRAQLVNVTMPPGDEVSLKIERVVDGGMDAEEALRGSS
jgi:hypothetical protein